MKFFNIGKHKISRIMLGTWSLGGEKNRNISYGDITQSNTQNILNYAFYEKKINFFDTANVYGDAEKRLGKFLKKVDRQKIFIATKVGCVAFNKKKLFLPKIISNQVLSSIKNLNNSYIDLVQLYGPNVFDKNLPYALEILRKFKEKKLINKIGLSLQNPKDYLVLRKLCKFDFIQTNFNLLDTRLITDNVINYINKDKAKLFVRTVLNFGIFTEEFLKKEKKFEKNDHRSKWKNLQISLWKNYIFKIKLLASRDIENTSYKFCNSFPITGLIIGATKKKHIDIATKKNNFIGLKEKERKKIIEINKEFNQEKIIKPFIPMKA